MKKFVKVFLKRDWDFLNFSADNAFHECGETKVFKGEHRLEIVTHPNNPEKKIWVKPGTLTGMAELLFLSFRTGQVLKDENGTEVLDDDGRRQFLNFEEDGIQILTKFPA